MYPLPRSQFSISFVLLDIVSAWKKCTSLSYCEFWVLGCPWGQFMFFFVMLAPDGTITRWHHVRVTLRLRAHACLTSFASPVWIMDTMHFFSVLIFFSCSPSLLVLTFLVSLFSEGDKVSTATFHVCIPCHSPTFPFLLVTWYWVGFGRVCILSHCEFDAAPGDSSHFSLECCIEMALFPCHLDIESTHVLDIFCKF